MKNKYTTYRRTLYLAFPSLRYAYYYYRQKLYTKKNIYKSLTLSSKLDKQYYRKITEECNTGNSVLKVQKLRNK